jgi:hypothetical protein
MGFASTEDADRGRRYAVTVYNHAYLYRTIQKHCLASSDIFLSIQ